MSTINKLTLELPSRKRKEEAILYIQEHKNHNSNINGSGGLDRYTDNYEEWVEIMINSHNGGETRPNRVNASTFFAIVDNKIVGMVNIRHRLNDFIIKWGYGHIGYGVRPTERSKGYAKEILRQALVFCKEVLHLKEIEIGCNKDNIASRKTIEYNNGIYIKDKLDEEGKESLLFKIKL